MSLKIAKKVEPLKKSKKKQSLSVFYEVTISMQCQECVKRRHSRTKTFVFTKSPHLNLASKDFKEAKQSNCFSADSLPDESAQCLRLGERQNLFKLKLKRQQNLQSNSIVRSQLVRNQLRQNYSIGFFEIKFEILVSQLQCCLA